MSSLLFPPTKISRSVTMYHIPFPYWFEVERKTKRVLELCDTVFNLRLKGEYDRASHLLYDCFLPLITDLFSVIGFAKLGLMNNCYSLDADDTEYLMAHIDSIINGAGNAYLALMLVRHDYKVFTRWETKLKKLSSKSAQLAQAQAFKFN
jgi:hypothetical protein